jgi:co-chaperonin GroES (HSP10)
MNPYQNLKVKEVNLNTEDDMKLKPIHNKVIVTDLQHGEQTTKSGLIILDDSTTDAGDRGIKPRWAKVYATGPEQKDVKVGDWILLEHGRWSLGQDLDIEGEDKLRIWLADHEAILAVSDALPE